MALGIIAASCVQIVPQHLRDIVQLLLRLLSSPQPLVRSMACMSITQFLPGCSEMVPAVVPAILERCKDRNKQVQTFAVVSLQNILSLGTVAPFMDPICQTLLVGLKTYKTKSLRKLYQCIGVVIQVAPEHMVNNGSFVLAALYERFIAIQANDPTAMVLFESMALVVNNLAGFWVDALPRLVDKAVQVINETAYAVNVWKQSPEVVPLLPHFLEHIVTGLKHPTSPHVNWSAVWALGEICQRVEPMLLEPIVPQIGEAFLGIFQRRTSGQLALPQLLEATCFTLMLMKHTSTLGDKWPSYARHIPANTLQELQSQYGYPA
ncbi:TRN1 [Symbiodinium pilosum]|uniref:TRN1 protein n=1 Tax=Symbiodinium pilosum TaxID=2952 RepID=A0A812XQ44_SYMPI|nr:TRN1 [Symbiodinium pilosum]